MPLHIQSDVIIIGAGPAACSIAASLSANGYRVLLIDRNTNRSSVGENLASTAKPYFPILKIDEERLDNEHLPIYQMGSLWGEGLPVWKDSIYNTNGFGWHLDREIFEKELLDNVIANGAAYFSYATISSLSVEPCTVSFSHQDKDYIAGGRFIVDCTGRNRFLQKQLAIKTIKYDTIIAANAYVNDVNFSDTIIEATENGWWYSASIPGSKKIISYYTNSKSEYLKANRGPQSFLDLFNKTQFVKTKHPHLEAANLSTITYRFANSEKSEKITGNNWLCAGDSAAAFDPISSQGISTAISMGITAGEAIHQKLWKGTNYHVREYESEYDELFSNYLVKRQQLYSMVKSFPESHFWLSNSFHPSTINHKTLNIK